MSYLLQTTSGNYYFRIRIPKSFRHLYQNRAEIKKSLHTKDLFEAQYVASTLSFQLKQYWKSQMSQSLITQFQVITEFDKDQKIIKQTAIIEPDKDQVQELQALETYQKTLQQSDLSSSTKSQKDDSSSSKKSHISQTQTRPSPDRISESVINSQSKITLLSQIITQYITEKIQKNSWTQATHKEKISKFNEFLKVISDKSIHDYNRQDAIKYLEYLKSKNLSPKTINKYTQYISSVFTYCTKHHNLQSNPFCDLTLQISTRPDRERTNYTDSELKTLFENLKYDKKRPSRYWTPLIMLFCGMRPAEISQLHKHHITQIDNIYCFKLDDSIDLKTDYSIRTIPIHQKLIDLGFLHYVNSIQSGQIFPDINLNVIKKTGPASRHWNRAHKKQPDIDPTKKSIYSLRHNFETQLRNNGVPETFAAELAGHKKGETMSYSRYAAPDQVQKLYEIINTIKYDFIEFQPYVQ